MYIFYIMYSYYELDEFHGNVRFKKSENFNIISNLTFLKL